MVSRKDVSSHRLVFVMATAAGLAMGLTSAAASDADASGAADRALWSVIGAPGSVERAQSVQMAREAIMEGRVDPRTVIFAWSELHREAPQSTPLPLNPMAMVGGSVFVDDFSGYELTNFLNPPQTLVSVHGQVTPFGGLAWANLRYGVATDAVMTNVLPGNPGGVAPMTQPAGGEPYLALARKTGLGPVITTFSTGANFDLPIFTPGFSPDEAHVRVATDWYLTDPETAQWWEVESRSQGVVVDRVFFGGKNLSGALSFALNGGGVLENFVSLGVLNGDAMTGQFFAPTLTDEFPFPVNQWFTTMSVLVRSAGGELGQGLFVKTPDTIANAFLDPRMAAGDIVPVDGDPLGWVNIYPGVADDPLTPQIEGVGLAHSALVGELPSTDGAFGLSTVVAGTRSGRVRIGIGSDPSPAAAPDFEVDDAFVDNIVAMGAPLGAPCLTLSQDDAINGADLATLLTQWNPNPNPLLFDSVADLSGDGRVDGADLAILLANWGPC